jgi:glutamyl-tRNA synthetase
LFNFLLARHHGGRFVLRIEDTDVERSRPEHTQALMADLRWLEMSWDEGPDVGGPCAPYEQSRRGALYDRRFAELETRGLAYPCFCSSLELDLSRRAQLAAGKPPRYAGTCRELSVAQRAARLAQGALASLRFRVPPGEQLVFEDFVHGPQRFATDDIGDFIVRRADGSAAFFFCNAMDDADMGVTHVLRGEDHLTNTPRQLLLMRAFDLPLPRYGHVALLVGPDGAPLSKRHGARSLRQLREQGFVPAAITNHLYRLGHSGGAEGLLTLAQMAAGFDIRHLGRAPARSDDQQLAVWQRDAAHALDPQARLAWLQSTLPAALDAARRDALLTAIAPNVVLPQDARRWSEIVLGDPPQLDEPALAIVQAAGGAFFAAAAAAALQAGNSWQNLVAATRAATGFSGPRLFKPLRCALTGVDHGPELAPLLSLMTPDSIHRRLVRFVSP